MLITLSTRGYNLDRSALAESYCKLFELVGLFLWDRLTKPTWTFERPCACGVATKIARMFAILL
jgi:hypothetical protein